MMSIEFLQVLVHVAKNQSKKPEMALCFLFYSSAELFYVWSIEHLRYRDAQFMLFGESMPGCWLGLLFIVTGIAGIVARQTRMDTARRHVRFTIFASLCVVNSVASEFYKSFVTTPDSPCHADESPKNKQSKLRRKQYKEMIINDQTHSGE